MVGNVNMISLVNKLFGEYAKYYYSSRENDGREHRAEAEPTCIQRRDLSSERRDLLLFWELGEGTVWSGWVVAKRDTGLRPGSLEKRGMTRIWKRFVDKGI